MKGDARLCDQITASGVELFDKRVEHLQWLAAFTRISISSFDWVMSAPLATFKINITFRSFFKFSVSRCKLVADYYREIDCK